MDDSKDLRKPAANSGVAEEEMSVFKGMPDSRGRRISPWWWIPTAYFGEGIPYVLVMTLSVIMYKKLGIDNRSIAFWTSIIYLPWVVKPLWSPLVDMYWTKRNWVIWMQLTMGLCFGGIAFGLGLPNFFVVTLSILWAVALLSATHDIACDGFYMLGLNPHQQAWYVGIRSSFYRLAMITGSGLLVMVAGTIETRSGLPPVSLGVVATVQGAEAAQLSEPAYPAQSAGKGALQIVVDKDSLHVPVGERRSYYLHLSGAPEQGKEVVVTTEFHDGDKSLKMTGGERLVFTSENWDVPTTVTVAADAKLRASVTAEFVSRAGNIPLSWSVVFVTCCVFFVLLFLYHGFILPRPVTDRPAAAGDRPPFTQALFWLLVLMIVAAGVVWGLNRGIYVCTSELKAWLIKGASERATLVWKLVFGMMGRILILALILWILFQIKALRRGALDFLHATSRQSGIEFARVFETFFQKERIGIMLTFLLIYRLGESQLVKLAGPFLLDTRANGGLALSTGQVGFVYGTVGILCLTIGGILGGLTVARYGLKKWLWPMAFAINLPDLVYVYMASAGDVGFTTVNVCVGIEQFGYGFGFTAYMVYMLYCARGEYKTAHFALTTGFMALGMMLPGMWSGDLQALLGYQWFFVAVCIFTIPGFLILPFLPIDPEFGKKAKE